MVVRTIPSIAWILSFYYRLNLQLKNGRRMNDATEYVQASSASLRIQFLNLDSASVVILTVRCTLNSSLPLLIDRYHRLRTL